MLRYVITNRACFKGDEPNRYAALLAQAAHLATTGVDFLQLREKDLSADALASLTRKLLATLRAHNPAPKLLINSRADVALATCADGVHLTSAPGQLTPAQVRALYAAASLPEPVISLSCHTLAEVTRAAFASPDNRPTHILFGPVFEKVVAQEAVDRKVVAEDRVLENSAGRKISAGTGLDLLRAACAAAAPIPVLALGGVTHANTAATLAAGTAGVASIRMFL